MPEHTDPNTPNTDPEPDLDGPDGIPFTRFEIKFEDDERPQILTVPGGHFERVREDDVRAAYSLRAALKDMKDPANEDFVSGIERGLRGAEAALRDAVAAAIVGEISALYEDEFTRWGEDFDEAAGRPLRPKDPIRLGELRSEIEETMLGAVDPDGLKEHLDACLNDPPDVLKDMARRVVEEQDWRELAEWTGAHALTWAARDLTREVRKQGGQSLSENWDSRIAARFRDGDYEVDAIQILIGEMAESAAEGLRQGVQDAADNEGIPLLLAIERLLGLHGEDNIPETVEPLAKPTPSPNPFDPATGLAAVPSDPFTVANIGGLMKARGIPSDREGEWTEDNFGRPVYRYHISGPPWGGMGQLSVVEEVETQQAWKMLEEGDLDAVTLYFLYLAYASDTGRRGGIDEPFRIDKQTVFHALGLHRRTDMSVKEKVKRIIKLNSYLRSFQIQLNRVSHNGDRVRTDATTPAYLWDTYVRGLREDDLFGEPQWGNFWIEGREGAWAHEFLHSERGGRQWTALPIRILQDIDRRNEWPRRILFHSLLMFRINRGGFPRKAKELLRWCQCDPSTLGRRKRSRRKKKLLNALDELKELGFQIEDARLRIKGRPFDEWLSERAEIHPPEEMGQKKYLGGNGKPKITAPREEVWTGQQIRALRKHVGETQADFAARFGLKGPMISLWENGHETPKPAHEKTLDNIAESVGFPSD